MNFEKMGSLPPPSYQVQVSANEEMFYFIYHTIRAKAADLAALREYLPRSLSKFEVFFRIKSTRGRGDTKKYF